MGAKEQNLSNNYLLTLPPFDVRIRINSAGAGAAYIGNPKTIKRGYFAPELEKKGVFIPGGRPVKLAPPGWADYIGYTKVVITPDMVGKTLAVFTSSEVKTGKQILNPDQVRHKEMIINAGGIHEVWREDIIIKKGGLFDE